MSDSTLYSRRLADSEADVWLAMVSDMTEVLSRPEIDRGHMERFLGMEDTICYVSTISGDPVGGTAVFVDRTRRALAFVDVVLKTYLRDRLLYTLLKSSLPFFRTVLIREVDVLLSVSESENRVPFPLAYSFEEWTKPGLDRLEFKEIESVLCYSFDLGHSQESTRDALDWGEEHDSSEIASLYWKVKDESHIDFSHVWLAQSYAASAGNVMTASLTTGELIVATSLEKLGASCVVGPLMIDKEEVEPSALAGDIVGKAIHRDCSTLEIPLVGKGQVEYVEAIASHCHKEPVVKKLKLLRKHL
ncbi:MAG: hypothetical protein JSW61_04260 [Candidatus Thorarchaeota archaeon]|nr:MAG: hypothetical protein JSW61_04260 [Candidatus Thorarchaeota archaeon]